MGFLEGVDEAGRVLVAQFVSDHLHIPVLGQECNPVRYYPVRRSAELSSHALGLAPTTRLNSWEKLLSWLNPIIHAVSVALPNRNSTFFARSILSRRSHWLGDSPKSP